MRSAAAILVAITVATVLGLAAATLLNERSQAFTLGVARSTATQVKPGDTVCQAPIAVPADAEFEGVAFAVGTRGRPGAELAVSVRAARPRDAFALGPTLARGTLPAGYPDVDRAPEHTVWLDRAPGAETVAVCLANRGRRAVWIYGDADAAARTSTAVLDGKATGADLALDFRRREARSLAGLLPAMLDRAALFRAQWIGAWTYWLLGAIVLLAVPALLVLALRTAAHEAP